MAKIYDFKKRRFSDQDFENMLDGFYFPDPAAKEEFKKETLILLKKARQFSGSIDFSDIPDLGVPKQEELAAWITDKVRIFMDQVTTQIYINILSMAFVAYYHKSENKKH